MSYSDSIKKLSSLADSRSRIQRDFLKSILLLSSTVFGVLISLRKVDEGNSYTNLLFAVALLLLALGILVGAIVLYSHVHMSKTLFARYKDAVTKQLHDRAERADPIYVNLPKFFSVCEISCYALLCSAMLLFCIYIFVSSL